MLVFKSFFKIIEHNKWSFAIYIAIFMCILFIAEDGSGSEMVDFEMSKVNAVIIDEDGNSLLIQGLKDYLSSYVYEVSVEDDEEKLQDALFFRKAEYILRIPKGFSENFLKGEITPLEKTLIEESPYAHFLDMQIENYWNTMSKYQRLMPELTAKELVRYTNKTLEENANVSITDKVESKLITVNFAMNYMSYVLMVIMILMIGMGLESFYKPNIYRRNACGPRPKILIYTELFSANLVLAIGVLIACLIVVSIKCNYSFFSKTGMLFVINSGMFICVVSSLGFLIGMLTKKRAVQNMIGNTLSLGFSFISGVFVSQEYLAEEVLAVAKFFPTYWYVEANKFITGATSFQLEELLPVIKAIGIQGGFAIAIACVGIVINKTKVVS